MATTNHPSLPQPKSPDTCIWRYMSTTQFIAMLEYGGLWFANLRNFADKREGLHPLEVLENRRRYIETMQSRGIVAFGDKEVDALLRFNKQMVDSTYANCWAESEYESAAFWDFYGGNGKTIAVKSSYERLKNVLTDKFYLGRMTYVPEDEYIFSIGFSLDSLMHKRRSFEHEKEIRAMFLDDKPVDPVTGHQGVYFAPACAGKLIPVDIGILIEKVIVRPNADRWLLELVERLVKRYGFGFPVVPSELLTPYTAASNS